MYAIFFNCKTNVSKFKSIKQKKEGVSKGHPFFVEKSVDKTKVAEATICQRQLSLFCVQYKYQI